MNRSAEKGEIMKTIEINELLVLLKRSDLRSVRSWCRKHEILIIKHGGIEFVMEAEFKEVFERPFIIKLKNKFGKNWEEVYRLYADGNIPALDTLRSIQGVKPNINNRISQNDGGPIFNSYLKKYSSYAKD